MRIIVAALCAALLSGCTVFNPYVMIDKNTAPVQATYVSVIGNIEDARTQLMDFANEQATINGASGIGTGVGLGGAAGSLIFGGPTPVTLGFATLGAVSYAVNQLYSSKAEAHIYLSGLSALSCVEAGLRPLAAANEALKSQRVLLHDAILKVVADQAIGDADQEARAIQAIEAGQDAEVRALVRISSEPGDAATAYIALRRVIDTINDQLLTVQPDAAAIARAASNIGATAQSFIPNIPLPEKKASTGPTAGMAAARRPNQQLENEIAELQGITTNVNSILASVQSRPQYDDCTLASQSPMPPLTVQADNPVAVSFNVSQTFPISGGNGPYSVQWRGSVPTVFGAAAIPPLKIYTLPGVTAAQFKAAAGSSYTLVVSDSTPGTPMTAMVNVTIPK